MIKLKEIPSDVLEWYYKEINNKIDCSSLPNVGKIFLADDTLKSLLTQKPTILLDIHNASPCILKDKSVVEKIFNYDAYISASQSTSYNIAKKIGINTCTYCNRNYTLSISHLDANTGRENNSTRISRPQFDHFFSQKDYWICK